MTDRELLDLAAKAAGMNLGKWKFYDGLSAKFVLMLDGEPTSNWWNPLADDGDAMRLAVKLLFEIDLVRGGIAIRHATGIKVLEAFNHDPYAATRRAIVRAAAVIGRGME